MSVVPIMSDASPCSNHVVVVALIPFTALSNCKLHPRPKTTLSQGCYLSSFQSCRSSSNHVALFLLVPIMSGCLSYTPFVASYSASFSTLDTCKLCAQDRAPQDAPAPTIHLAPKAPKLLPPPSQQTQQHRLAVQTVAGAPAPGHCDPASLAPAARLGGRSSE